MTGMLEEFLLVRPDRSGGPGYVGQTDGDKVALDQLVECARHELECENVEFIEFTMPSGATVIIIADADGEKKALLTNLSATEFVQQYHDSERVVRGTVLLFRNKCWETPHD